MKKNYVLLTVVALTGLTVLHSCKKEKTATEISKEDYVSPKGYVSQFKGMKRLPNETIKINVSDPATLKNLASLHKKNTLEVESQTGNTLFMRSTEIPAINNNVRQVIYLGAIVKATDLGDITKIVPVLTTTAERNPITIYADFPTDSISRVIKSPSPNSDKSYIRAALKAGSGKQLSSFRFQMESFKKNEELKLAFRANVNIGGLLNITALDSSKFSQKKTSVRVEFTQENFAVNIEPPIEQPFLKDPINTTKFGNTDPLIVSSIVYGRKGIMTIESDSSYSSVTQMLNIVLKAPISKLVEAADKVAGNDTSSLGVTLGMTKEQIKTLQTSVMKVYIIGVNGDQIFKVVQGLTGFTDILAGGGIFSPESPGVPLYYTLNYLSDFSPYWNKFQVTVTN
ncbi:thiol-activated cytolysin family protein [Pedobacter gandavensis]|uniref:thiol-activated cytolysin family protein n=1 Tax=Pedobacter gandavensis TaxID=2679963 RepID=UPI00292F6416|nr:thiol-activated cytolysin family protein [Pedobacter gandavensis]